MPAPRSFHPLSCALAAAVGGHLCLLAWLTPGPAERRVHPPLAAPLAAVVVVRAVAAVLPVTPHPVAAVETAAAPAAAARRAAAPRGQAPSVSQARPVVRAPDGSPASAPAAPPPAQGSRLQLPPSQHVQFTAQRGARSGHAELRWQRTGSGGYELLLVLRYEGEDHDALIQSSRGDIGEAGLQPRRYADRRGDAGLRSVTFGPEDEAGAPPPGAQDRLSWLVQLAAVAAAWTEVPPPGSRIVLPIAGVRGELDDWAFEVVAQESGPQAEPVLHLSRAPLHRHDHRIDVWLDARGGGWPVRMSWSHPLRETLTFERENALQQR